ncbi:MULTISPECIES: hypothetical protein [Delftia]|uniref:Uncharacterized protein n=1 Tax=Delftia tsuruhatensis TaxID=180282 RepID=A0ABM6E5J3_9BURK|nr:hypothetical protein [Delftia tsuruhatensis]AOV02787.1 hypothetical protein BI380_16285 [Delftia tsuruhatensis]
MSGELLGQIAAWTVAFIWALGAVTVISWLVHLNLKLIDKIRMQIMGESRVWLALRLLREHDAAKRGEG